MKKSLITFITLLSVLLYLNINFTNICSSNSSETRNINADYKIYGDLLYKEIPISQLHKNGCTINLLSEEVFIRVVGLSEEGKNKEIIIIPQYINGIEVKEIGEISKSIEIYWESEKLRRVYMDFAPKSFYNVFKQIKCILCVNEIPNDCIINQHIYISSYNHVNGDIYNNVERDYRGQSNYCYYANVSYFYNYDDAPENGYYFIDDYEYGTKINYIPPNPTREGFLFEGWYKEKECVNKWNFDSDTLPIREYVDSKVKYQETRLFAKWIKE